MKNQLQVTTNQMPEPKAMSSLLIAQLTGKKHSNIIRDIRIQLYGGLYHHKFDSSNLNYPLIQGLTVTYDDCTKRTKEILLDREHTITLITGYNVKARHAINKRWLELEQVVQAKLPNGPKAIVQSLTLLNKPRHKIREFLSEYTDISIGVKEFISNMNNNPKADLEDRNRTLQSLRKAVDEYYDGLTARDITNAALCERALKLIAEKERYLARLSK